MPTSEFLSTLHPYNALLFYLSNVFMYVHTVIIITYIPKHDYCSNKKIFDNTKYIPITFNMMGIMIRKKLSCIK